MEEIIDSCVTSEVQLPCGAAFPTFETESELLGLNVLFPGLMWSFSKTILAEAADFI